MEKSNRMKSLEGKSIRDLILLEKYIRSKKKEFSEYNPIDGSFYILPKNKALNDLYAEWLVDIEQAIINAAFN